MKKRKGMLYADIMLSSVLVSLVFLFALNVHNHSLSFKAFLTDYSTITDTSMNIISTLKYEMSIRNEIENFDFFDLPSNSEVTIYKDYIYDKEIYMIQLDLSLNDAEINEKIYMVNMYD